jgi:hypothetical protein
MNDRSYCLDLLEEYDFNTRRSMDNEKEDN